jgi:hypothetical protein
MEYVTDILASLPERFVGCAGGVEGSNNLYWSHRGHEPSYIKIFFFSRLSATISTRKVYCSDFINYVMLSSAAYLSDDLSILSRIHPSG